jgi:hypothetical protein
MLSCRKPVAALAALTAAAAVAVPAASADAATTGPPTVDPQVCVLLNIARAPFGPTSFFGGASLAAVLSNVADSVNCPPPPPLSPLLPTLPTLPGQP